MELTKTLLEDCEQRIAKGSTSAAIKQLLAIKDQTGYKSDIINLSNRWKVFARDQMSDTYSKREESLQNSRLNKDTLRLIAAIGRELAGEKVDTKLFADQSKNNPVFPLFFLLVAMGLTAVAVGAISYFALKQAPAPCSETVSLNGNWVILSDNDNNNKELGTLKLVQKDCQSAFTMSGALRSVAANPGREVDFSSKVGAIHNEEIIFVYENFDGEVGVCRGVVPSVDKNEFSVHCIDLAGYDKNGQEKMTIVFRKPEG